MLNCGSLELTHYCAANTTASSTRCNIAGPQFVPIKKDCTDTDDLARRDCGKAKLTVRVRESPLHMPLRDRKRCPRLDNFGRIVHSRDAPDRSVMYFEEYPCFLWM